MTAETAARQQKLESWKEIAAYINRDVRTARRWEKDRGLPVRRLPGTRSGVYAFATEIDDWVNKGANQPSITQVRSEAPPAKRSFGIWLFAAVAVLFAVALVAVLWPTPPTPRLRPNGEVTHTGWIKDTLIRRGDVLYYQTKDVASGMSAAIRRIGDSGDRYFAALPPGPRRDMLDVSPDGSSILYNHTVPGVCESELWRLPVPAGQPVRLGSICATTAAWSPDARKLAYVDRGALYLANADGSEATRTVTLPSGLAIDVRWRPGARHLRFVLSDKEYRRMRLWDIDLDNRQARPLLPGWTRDDGDEERDGQWTADGRYYLFSATHTGSHGIWSLRGPTYGPWATRPTLLASLERAAHSVTPEPRGRRVFALVGLPLRGEILRLVPQTRQFSVDPKWNWLSGGQTAFSPDGQRLVYLSYPEHHLWVADLDGANQRPLTHGEIHGALPEWSPNGRRIAYMTWSAVTTPTRIRIVSPEGETQMEVAAPPNWQGAPRWLSDHEIVFGENDLKFPIAPTCTLHLFDLSTRNMAELPNTAGLWTARPSPSGHYIAALNTDQTRVMLYDRRTASVRELFHSSEGTLGDNPTWSRDGDYIYIDTPYAHDPAVYRIRIADGKAEKYGDLAGIQRVVQGIGLWLGLAPDDSLLILRQVEGSEITSWDWTIP